MARMTAISLAILCGVLTIAASDNVPVLMWSQSRPIVDLPKTFAGNSINENTFLDEYLSPLIKNAGHHIVAFIQDKLNVDDFSKYADIYNQFSNGGAFKNIKKFMDGDFTANLPSVRSPVSAINNLKKQFKDRVLEVKSSEHVENLKMTKDRNYLIIVSLPTVNHKNEESSISENDKKVGDVIKALNKRSLDYTALFTGQRSTRAIHSVFKGRHLLLETDNNTSIVANVSGQMLFYCRSITIKVLKSRDEEKVTIQFPTDPNLYSFDRSIVDNSTRLFILETEHAFSNSTDKDALFNVTIMVTPLKLVDRWRAVNFTIYVTDLKSKETLIDGLVMDLRESEMELPPIFSYHCSDLTLYPRMKSEANATYYATITLNGFQFQPFGLHHDRFSDSWDCVGFFTTPILMGLFPVGIFTVILFLGMYMLAQLTTMDRFDDPKGKTITVNVNE